jgi:hypothetical protein
MQADRRGEANNRFRNFATATKKSGNEKKSSTGPREFLIHKGIAVLFLSLKGKSFLE